MAHGDNSEEVAASLNDLGANLADVAMTRTMEAIAHYEGALGINRCVYGDKHPGDVACGAFNNIAAIIIASIFVETRHC